MMLEVAETGPAKERFLAETPVDLFRRNVHGFFTSARPNITA